jgi:hypothetical protein
VQTGQASPLVFEATLSDERMLPRTDGRGEATVTYDPDFHTLRIEATFSGLASPTTAARILCCPNYWGYDGGLIAIGSPTLPGFPTGVTNGSYDSGWLDLTLSGTWGSEFVEAHGGTLAAAEMALVHASSNQSGATTAVFSIVTNGGAGIEGFLDTVPEPAIGILLVPLAGLLVAARGRRFSPP